MESSETPFDVVNCNFFTNSLVPLGLLDGTEYDNFSNENNNYQYVNDGSNDSDGNGFICRSGSIGPNVESKMTPSPVPHNGGRSTTNLFVNNLPRKLDRNTLRDLFSPYGNIVSLMVMRDIHTGDSRGTVFVRYATTEEAKKAIAAMNGQRIHGSKIFVDWAKKRHDKAPVGEDRKKIFKLFVRNIPLDVTVDALTVLFQYYGTVKSVTLHEDTKAAPLPEQKRRIAFVTYLFEGDAECAAEHVHNTRPFTSCCRIPLLVKLADEAPHHCVHNTKNISSGSDLTSSGDGLTSSGSSDSSPWAGRFQPFVNVAPPRSVCSGSDDMSPTSTMTMSPTPTGATTVQQPFYGSIVTVNTFVMPHFVPGFAIGETPSCTFKQQLILPNTTGIPFVVSNAPGMDPVMQTAGVPNLMLRDIAVNPYCSVETTPMRVGEYTGTPLYMSSAPKPVTVKDLGANCDIATEPLVLQQSTSTPASSATMNTNFVTSSEQKPYPDTS